jgi:hypothetical protein
MPVITRGDKELALRFEQFPRVAHAKLAERMQNIVDGLQARARAAAPHKTGKLQSEITGRVFSDMPDRVAGYVTVFTPDPGPPGNEYAKAATLEYGTDKPRRVMGAARFSARLGRFAQRRLVARVSKPAHISAFRYLRGPLEDMREEIDAELAAAIAEATQEGAA